MKKFLYMSLICAAMIGCTDKFEDIDTDKSGISSSLEESELEPAINYLTLGQRAIYPDNSGPYPIAAWVLQVQSNLNVDIWAGYLCSGTNFLGGYTNQTYNLVDNWNGYMLDYWNKTMSQVFYMRKSYEQSSKSAVDKGVMAMGILTRVIASERTVDMYGILPYSSFGESVPSYDGAEDVYKAFFSEIDEAQDLLASAQSLNDAVSKDKDLFYQGDVAKWKRLSNTLRLRLAMRIVKANPQLAKQQAEKALSHSFGMIEDNTQSAGFTGSNVNGLNVLAQVWGDTRMSADMESILVGYNDPRLPKYFAEHVDGGYRGVRVGSEFSQNSGTKYSALGTSFPAGATYETSPIFLVNAAEAWFLRAEAALRGFAGAGDAPTAYSKGVEMSMKQYGITDAAAIEAYLNSQAKPQDWTSRDEKVAKSVAAASKVTPKFADATDNETKLEKIITQKWIAMFPGGSSTAWSEYRRTGYPRQLPPYMTYFKPTIDVTYGPKVVNNARKAAIPQSQYEVNPVFVKEAVDKYLGGKDDIGTQVWWDVNVPNL
ncbi:MAG: SusD/RagB family nutrient-binding outer membrane lipoprotein [Bacteroidales bacterium]